MGIIGSKINRDLPNNEYQAAVNANLPSVSNPYATIADIVSTNIYNSNGVIGAARKAQVTDTLTIRDLADATTLLSINQSNGNITTSESGGRWRHGNVALAYSEMVGAVQLQAAVGGGATWSGFHAYNNANALGVQASLAANKFGNTQIRTSHDLYFSTGWTGGFGTSSTERMRLHNATGNFSIGTPSDIARLGIRGVGSTSATVLFRARNVSNQDKYIINDAGQQASSAGFSAVISASAAQNNSCVGYAIGYSYLASGATSFAMLLTAAGNTPTGLFVQGQSSSSGVVRTATFDNKATAGTQHIGAYAFARNGSQYNVGLDGLVGGADATAPSFYGAGVRGGASHQLDVLQYGGLFSAQFGSIGVTYTKDTIGAQASAIGTNGAGGSTAKVVGIKAFTSGVAGTGDRIAIWMPLAGNNGVAVLGADARNGNSTLQVTGEIEMFGNGTGFYMYQPDGTRRSITLNNAGAFVIS